MSFVAASYLDILNVINGTFGGLIDVDEAVCAKSSVNVAAKGQLRHRGSACRSCFLFHFVDTRPKYVWNSEIAVLICAGVGIGSALMSEGHLSRFVAGSCHCIVYRWEAEAGERETSAFSRSFFFYWNTSSFAKG